MQGNVVIWVLSAAIAILGQIQATFNLLGWIVVGLSALFSGWYAYIQYLGCKELKSTNM